MPSGMNVTNNSRSTNKLNGSRSTALKKPSTETASLPSRLLVGSGGKSDTSKALTKLGSEYPAIATSSIKLEDNPIYEPVGKPITQVDLDEGEHTPESQNSDY